MMRQKYYSNVCECHIPSLISCNFMIIFRCDSISWAWPVGQSVIIYKLMKLYTMLPNQDWSWLYRWLIHLAWWVVSWQRWIFPRKLIFCQGPGQWQLLFLAKQILKNFKGPLKDYLRTCKRPLKDYWRTIKAIRAIYRIVRPLGLVKCGKW